MTRNIVKFTNRRSSVEESKFKISTTKLAPTEDNSNRVHTYQDNKSQSPRGVNNNSKLLNAQINKSPSKILQSLSRTSNHSPINRSLTENNYDLYGLGLNNSVNPDSAIKRAKLTSEVKEAYNNDFGTISKPMNTTLSK